MRILRESLLALAVAVGSAASQWTQVTAVGTGECYAVISSADTIWASMGNVVHVSTNGGSSWNSLRAVGDSLFEELLKFLRVVRLY